MVKLNRRQFVALGVGSAGTALLGNCNWLRRDISSQPLQQSSANAALYQSSNGLLELELEARKSFVDLGSKQAYLLTYNGQIPPPRLEARSGDKVRIHFTNNLEQPTNIHYHGLHIRYNY